MDATPRFASKVDWWLGILLVALPVILAASVLGAWRAGAPLAALPEVLVLVLYALVVVPVRYELADDAVVIRFGVMRRRVPYRDIRRVVPTRNPLSSPALSLDRLHLDCGSAAGPNISPADKAGFLGALAARCPHLALRGGSLLPASR